MERSMQKNLISSLLALGLAATIIGCTTVQTPNQKQPGFLTDYHILKAVESTPDGTQIYSYTNPNAKRSDYHAVIIEPVIIYQTATESGISEAQIKNAQKRLTHSLKQIAAKQLPIVTKPGRGVARLQVAITGAELEGDGFSPRYLIPISGLIKLGTMATGLDNKKPVLAVETKTTDSRSGKLLRATVTTISGEKFRMDVHTPEEFEELAKQWIKEAVMYSNSPEKLKDYKSNN